MSSLGNVRKLAKAPPLSEHEALELDVGTLAHVLGTIAECHSIGVSLFWRNLAARALTELKSREGREVRRFYHERWRIR